MTSFCTRVHPEGARVILPEEFAQFLADDHLCSDCAPISDNEHAAAGVLNWRQSTVPEVTHG